MRLLMLGGGYNQLNGIIHAVNNGHEVVLADYLKDAPGRKYAKYNEMVSTFDVEGNIEIAKKYSVDGVMTLGTDQPVYTVAKVAEKLDLPRFIDIRTAKAVTNKKIMKEILTKYKIPTVKYRLINKDFNSKEIDGMNYPLVIKPIDSQGQRGVYKLHTLEEIKSNISNTLKFSRDEEALLEEYYEGDEITVSAWVDSGICHILTITDRKTFQNKKHIGICFAHKYPSAYARDQYSNIEKVMLDITNAFEIKKGPLYVQLLMGEEGLLVNELACRIGGAYEDFFIPYLTKFDILDEVVSYSLGIKERFEKDYIHNSTSKYLSVELFFAKAGKVSGFTSLEHMEELPGVLKTGINLKQGDVIPFIEDATARAGYMIIVGNNYEQLNANIENAFKHLKIWNDEGENLVINMNSFGR